MSEAQQPASAATADPPLPPPADLSPLSANNNNFIPDTVAGVAPSPARCSPSIPSSSGGNNNTVQPCTKHPADPPPLPANDATVAADAPPPASAAAADAPLPSSKNIDIFMTSISEFLSGASHEPVPSNPMEQLAKRCKLPNNWRVCRGGGGRAGKGVFSSLIIRDENKKEIKKEEIHKRVGSNTDFDLRPALKELESINSTINNSLNDKFALGKKMLGIDNVALQSNDGWNLRIWSLNGQAILFRSYQSFYASLDVDDLPGELIPIRNIECDHIQDELNYADVLRLNLMNNSKISAWTAKKAQVNLKGSKFVSPTGIVYTNLSDAWYAAGFRRKCLIYNIKQILDLGFTLKHVHNHMKQFLSPDTFLTVESLMQKLRGSNAVSKYIFQVHLFQNDDDALRVLLRSTAQPHSSLKGNRYIAPNADEMEEAIIERRLAKLKRNFIWDEAHLPDEEKEAEEEAEEMTAKKKKKKKKAIPSTHSQPLQKKQRRKKKSRQPQWSDEEDCEEDYEDEEVVPRSTILRSAKKEEVDYKEKEEKDDDDDCESEDEGKEKDDEDAGHLESDCESEDEGKEKEEKDDDDAGHLESDCESEDEDKTLKQNLILQLSMMNVRLAPSNIDGIGVFAAVDIPEGITLFSTCNQDISNQDTPDQTIPLSADEVDSLPSFPQKMVKNFLLPDDSGMRHIPATGLHGLLGQSMYMNSSYGLASHTNVAQDTSVDAVGSYGYTVFKTTKVVMEGEELLWSYKYPGCFKGKRAKFYYMNNNPGEQWMDGTIDEYFTKDERNAMAVKEGKDPTNKHKRGMYKFTLDFDGEEDYFSDEDETVEIEGMTGAQLWKEY